MIFGDIYSVKTLQVKEYNQNVWVFIDYYNPELKLNILDRLIFKRTRVLFTINHDDSTDPTENSFALYNLH